MTSKDHDLQIPCIAHGAVRPEQTFPEYGAERRRLTVLKYRDDRSWGGHNRLRHPAARALDVAPGKNFLKAQLHELLIYLGQRVATLLITAHQELIGSSIETPVDAIYLVDPLTLIRHCETKGEVRQAISVMKERSRALGRTIRGRRIEHAGIYMGSPWSDLPGVLTGVPIHEKNEDNLRAGNRP